MDEEKRAEKAQKEVEKQKRMERKVKKDAQLAVATARKAERLGRQIKRQEYAMFHYRAKYCNLSIEEFKKSNAP